MSESAYSVYTIGFWIFFLQEIRLEKSITTLISFRCVSSQPLFNCYVYVGRVCARLLPRWLHRYSSIKFMADIWFRTLAIAVIFLSNCQVLWKQIKKQNRNCNFRVTDSRSYKSSFAQFVRSAFCYADSSLLDWQSCSRSLPPSTLSLFHHFSLAFIQLFRIFFLLFASVVVFSGLFSLFDSWRSKKCNFSRFSQFS